MKMRQIIAAGLWPLLCLVLLAPGCGDALSSLDVARREIYAMQLDPFFVSRGQANIPFTGTVDPKLQQMLVDKTAYLTSVTAGEGTQLGSFNVEDDGTVKIKMSIYALANEGDRELVLQFAGTDNSYEARGSFVVVSAKTSGQ